MVVLVAGDGSWLLTGRLRQRKRCASHPRDTPWAHFENRNDVIKLLHSSIKKEGSFPADRERTFFYLKHENRPLASLTGYFVFHFFEFGYDFFAWFVCCQAYTDNGD